MYRQRFGSKYGNKTSSYNGVLYHSKKEAGYAKELDYRLKAGDIKGWERQIKISLDVNGYHICNYYMDFVVEENDGTKTYVEVKGFVTDVWRIKYKLFEALYGDDPNINLLVVK